MFVFWWLCLCCILTPFFLPFTRAEHTAKPKAYSIFVGNLPANTKRKTVLSLFKTIGTPLSVRFRRSNGGKLQKIDLASQTSIIAFVDFETVAEARAAAAALNNHQLGANVLRVDVQAGSKNSGTTDAKRTAFVGNLAFNTTDNHLRQAFGDCGKIDYVRLNQSKKGCNGTAFVCFKEAASVVAALKLNGSVVNGRPVRINRSEKKQAEVAAKRPVEEEAEEEEADSDNEDESEDEVAAPVVPVKKAVAKPKAAASNKNKKGGKKNNA